METGNHFKNGVHPKNLMSRKNKKNKKMHKQRLGILIVASLGVLATFLPWVKSPIIGSINGTQGPGWMTLLLFAVPLVISLLNDKTKALKGGQLYGAIIPSLIAGVYGIGEILSFNSTSVKNNPFLQILEASVSIEYGLYLVVLAGIALPIVAFLIKD